VSQHHCTLRLIHDGIRLHDLNSTNGTFITGKQVCDMQLHERTVFAVGNSELVFEPLEESVTEKLSLRDSFGDVLGVSQAMRRIFAILHRVAPSDASVLLQGETGTGKGALAEAIHQQSHRSAGPFVVVDCAALSEHLFESELFGHEQGAFSGAHERREGLLSRANGGTLFLDEVGELRPSLQPKFLRALESRCFRPIGSSQDYPFDARIICATNVDLRKAVNQQQFRSDLYYRLNTIRLVVPPLRDRADDVAPILASFYRKFTSDASAIPPASLVRDYRTRDWPGNVRELRNELERTVLMPSSRPATEPLEPDSFRDAKARAVGYWERDFLRNLMMQHDGNLSRAARAASMDRSHLRKLLRTHRVNIAEIAEQASLV
jgi:transcriptional regulator with PAS, ATPase and Fis domain